MDFNAFIKRMETFLPRLKSAFVAAHMDPHMEIERRRETSIKPLELIEMLKNRQAAKGPLASDDRVKFLQGVAGKNACNIVGLMMLAAGTGSASQLRSKKGRIEKGAADWTHR